MAIRAETDPDIAAREAWANDAPIAQERWRCPAATRDDGRPKFEPFDSRDQLDAGCKVVLDAVDRLTGYGKGCKTCPLAATRREVVPWIYAATLAWADREVGQLETRTGPHPDAILIHAIDVVRDASNRRQIYELQHPPSKPTPSE